MNMKQISDIISEVLGTSVSESTSTDNTPAWDSLKTLQIVMALDEAGYEIPLEKIAEIQSVKDILAFVQKRD